MVLVLGDGPHLPKRHGGMRLREGMAWLIDRRVFELWRGLLRGQLAGKLYTFWMLVPLLMS